MSYRTVVVGYDGSEDADQALAAALEQVEASGTVHVVTAYHPLPAPEIALRLEELPPEYRVVWDPYAVEQERQEAALRRVADAGVRCRGHVVADDPATAVIDVARQEAADLVVVGSRGRGRVARFLRGSVSARVAVHAPTSVLVVHPQPPREPG